MNLLVSPALVSFAELVVGAVPSMPPTLRLLLLVVFLGGESGLLE